MQQACSQSLKNSCNPPLKGGLHGSLSFPTLASGGCRNVVREFPVAKSPKSARSTLLGESGGMPPPPGKFRDLGLLRLFLVQFQDKLIAGVGDQNISHYISIHSKLL